MRHILLIGSILFLAACSVEPGSEKWCDMKKDQPKSEWSELRRDHVCAQLPA